MSADPSMDLHRWSSELSCAAMTEMAQKEACDANDLMMHQVQHPAHARFCERMDTVAEHQWMAAGLTRRLCYDPNTRAVGGAYADRFGQACRTERFEQWTRRRDFSQPFAPENAAPIDATFWNYANDCPLQKCGRGGRTPTTQHPNAFPVMPLTQHSSRCEQARM